MRFAGFALVAGRRPARHPARAALPQAARDDGRGGTGSEPLEFVERAAKGVLVIGLTEC